MKSIRQNPTLLTCLFVLVFILLLGAANTSVYVVTVQLINSSGGALTGGSLRYYDGSWNPANPNPDGTFTVTTSAASLTYEMTYTGGTQTQSNVPTTTTPVVFQTLNVTVQLKNSSGQLMDTGTIQYYGGTWMDFGATSNGQAVKELLPYNYKFRMSYSSASVEKYQNVGADPIVIFQTANVSVQLKNSAGQLMDAGTVQYYAGTWQDFGSTSAGQTAKELLPYNYKFRMTYSFASNEKYQDVTTNPTVVFQTKNVAVQLKSSASAALDTGVVQYYAGSWNVFGSTSGGQTTKELLPYNYKFRMTYAFASNEKYQDVNVNPTVVFQTKNVAVQLKSSTTAALDTGVVQYYAGSWNPFGSTSNGQTTKELLPYNYKFRMTYAFASNEKYQDVTTNPNVVFQTKNVLVQLRDSQSQALDPGSVQYYAGVWKDFGATANGDVRRELLPYNYKFRMTYAFASNEKYQDVGVNATVLFQTVKVSVLLKDKSGFLIDRGIVMYYAGQWKDFGSTTGGLVEKQLLPYNYKFRMTFDKKSYEKYQNTGTDPAVIFQMDYIPVPPSLVILEPENNASTQNESVVVSGKTDNGTVTVKVNGTPVPVGTDGSFTTTVGLTVGPNTIIITATNTAGTKTTVTRTVTRTAEVLPPDPVTVAPPLDPTVATTMDAATEFLYTGPNPIQTNVDTAKMEPVRAAVVRGKVLMRDGGPLSGVKVNILNHPEFGQTLSRADGWFDMAVNGGGYLTINYEKSGYFGAQRQVNVPWQDFAVADSLILIQADPHVTAVDFSDTVEVARGSVVTDQDGTRQATLMFKQGTKAEMILANGDTVRLDSLHVRATEYTVGPNGPAAMPAELPPNVAYTYCVELSADEAIAAGAEEVRFDKPVPFYVENFLGFPVGTAVPVGYYDRKKAAWVPSDDGCVIGITNISGGMAELDYDDDGIAEAPDSLALLGIDAQERKNLASLYSVGQSLWRVPITHFTPWDCNWPPPPAPPPEARDEESVKYGFAESPKQKKPERKKKYDKLCKKPNQSTIDIQNQALGEAVPVTGTGVNIYYKNSQFPVLEISLSDSILPKRIVRIELDITVAGRTISKRFAPEPNLTYLFVWDRRDAYGRIRTSEQEIGIRIGYAYPVYYYLQRKEPILRSWSGMTTAGFWTGEIWTRDWRYTEPVLVRTTTVSYKQEMIALVGEWEAPVQNLGGWSLGMQHRYDPIRKTVYFGDGSVRTPMDLNAKHTAVKPGRIKDGIQGTVCAGPDGSIYFTDWYDRIYQLRSDSAITHIAGSGQYAYDGDQKPAAQAQLDSPEGIDFGPDGCLYIADTYNYRIRKVDLNGTITTIAGTGEEGFSGDGGPAVEAKMDMPYDVACGPDGSIYISFYARIRKVDPNGIISTVAGTGLYGYSGDNGPAIRAQFNGVFQIAIGPDSCLYIADYRNNAIRMIKKDGTVINYKSVNNPGGLVLDGNGNIYVSMTGYNKIVKIDSNKNSTTIAGTGSAGYTGDGGPAVNARLKWPDGIDIGPDGSVYFSDRGNHCVRKINPSGIITTVAGTGVEGFNGDGGPAALSQLHEPRDVAMHPSGNLYIADAHNLRIRMVDASGIIHTVAGTGQFGYNGEGIAAKEAEFWSIQDLFYGWDGCLYVADSGGNRIRKIDRNGLVVTIAGTGEYGFSGDNGPAVSAKLNWPSGVAVDPDGNIYVVDSNNYRIRKIAPDGRISTIAGTGEYGFSGDDSLATQAKLGAWDVEIGPNGDIYFSDSNNNRVRKISATGIISTVAGNGDWGFGGDGGPAVQASIGSPTGLAISQNGDLYVMATAYIIPDDDPYGLIYDSRIRLVTTDGFIKTYAGGSQNQAETDGSPAMASPVATDGRIALSPDNDVYYASWQYDYIRKISPILPKYGLDDIFIASEDGSEVYVFNSQGRHLRTVDAMTDSVIYKFMYDAKGLLVSVKDRDGLITRVERDADSKPLAIVSPFGQRTGFTLDANGYLSSVTNPAGETIQFTYTSNGLMTRKTDAKGYVSSYSYNNEGRLVLDKDPAGGFSALSSEPIPDGWATHVTTAEGRKQTYYTERLRDGSNRSVNVSESGLQTVSLQKPDGTSITTYPDGTITTQQLGPDPRYGMQAPLIKSMTTTMPSGLKSTFSQGRTITEMSGLEVTGLTDTITVNGKKTISIYTGSNKQYTTISPTGRRSFSWVDDKGRVVADSIPGIRAVNYMYDDKGFLTQTEQAGRKNTFAYNLQGRLESITDPLNRTSSVYYDSVGRVTRQVLADSREIHYSYDSNGNLLSLTPPGKPAHLFDYTPVDLTKEYDPPVVPDSAGATHYFYNLDKQIVKTLLPDSSMIAVEYDTAGCGCSGVGKPSKITFDRGTTQFKYDAVGNLAQIISPSIIDTLKYTYDGSLPKSVTWKGAVNGSVGVTYNNDFQVTSQSVNGSNAASFIYDNDGLLSAVSNMQLARNSQNGILTGTTLGNVTTNYSYNNLGELSEYSAQYSGTDLFRTRYHLDAVGRIDTLWETVQDIQKKYAYRYDLTGRLVQVDRNDTTISVYSYDSNGNRITHTTMSGTESGTYDAQDRMLSYGNATFGYTATGSLKWKAENGDTTRYNYDLMCNLLSVQLPNGTYIQYLIDGQNRRMAKIVNGSIKKRWLYQNQLNIVAELDSAGNLVSRFVYGTKGHVPDYMVKNGVTYRFVTDHLGSVRIVVNPMDGSVVQRLDYNEFGNVITNTNPDFQPFAYAGGLYDGHTDLLRFGARDYDSQTGRWMSKEPMGFYGKQTNFYIYSFNNPIMYCDPSGKYLIFADNTSREQFIDDYVRIYSTEKGKELITSLARDNKVHRIIRDCTTPKGSYSDENDAVIDPCKKTPYWYQKDPLDYNSLKIDNASETRQLAHELGEIEVVNNPEYSNLDSRSRHGISIAEYENQIMPALNEGYRMNR